MSHRTIKSNLKPIGYGFTKNADSVVRFTELEDSFSKCGCCNNHNKDMNFCEGEGEVTPIFSVSVGTASHTTSWRMCPSCLKSLLDGTDFILKALKLRGDIDDNNETKTSEKIG